MITPAPASFNVVDLREYLPPGQRVQAFAVDIRKEPPLERNTRRHPSMQNLFHSQQLYDAFGSLEERGTFVLGIFGEAEADEETALAAAFAFSHHDGFEGIDVGPAYFVHLLDLNGEPVVGEEAAFGGLGAYREYAAVHAHVANLHFVGDAAQRDDGPVLELERRKGAELFNRPRQIADNERVGLMGLPSRLALLHAANIPQPLGHHPASRGRNVDADPLTAKILRRERKGIGLVSCGRDKAYLCAACTG